ncbi:condensation domain-containing protein, partial [Pseudomonas sp. GD04042]
SGLARGYQGRAALTAERFLPDPFGEPGGRLYRTGDLTRYRADGVIEYVGRIDHQVKIRGFRIELGEIEAALQAHPAIREAVVLDLEGSGGKQLAGYLLVAAGQAESIEQQESLRAGLREQLKAALPDYMVPAHLLFLDHLPLTANGKLDRKALPKPDLSLSQQTYVAPRTALEQRIATIWAEVLKVERVGLTDNFFELGGDSIISLQVVGRARQAGIGFTPKELFQHQTVQGLAAVARTEGEQLRIDQGPVTGSTVLIPVQQEFFEWEVPERHHWNQSVLLKPREPLEAGLFEQALEAMVQHHDALRLGFELVGGTWQGIFRESREASLLWQRDVVDGTELERCCNEAQRSLSLQLGPLLRALLARLPDGSERLLICAHHLVVDGVSWRVLFEDLQTAYRQRVEGRPVVLPAKTSSVKAWAERLQAFASSAALQAERAYWQAQLQGASGDLPRDCGGTGLQTRHAEDVTVQLDKELTQRLLQQAPAAYRTQINDLLLTALARVVARWCETDSILLQLEGHGREDLFEDIDLSRTVGWFTTVFPVRLTPAADLEGSIKGIKEQLRAIPNKGIGFGVLRHCGADEVRQALQALPQPRITFNYLGQFDGSFDGEEALFKPLGEARGAEQSVDAPLGNWLEINSRIYDGTLSLGWTFSREMFDGQTIQRLADAYIQELQALIAHCCDEGNRGVTPSDFPLARLGQAELDALPMSAGEIADIYPLAPMQQGMLFHSLFGEKGGDYINQMRVDVDGLDVERFRQAWQGCFQAHDILRTGFVGAGPLGQAVQVVLRQVALPLFEHDWRGLEDQQAALGELAGNERVRSIELHRAPLLRLTLVRLDERRHHLIYTSHHILMDGWSNSRLLGEVLERYAGKPVCPPSGRYRDYIEWLQRQDADACQAFWKEQLAALETPTQLVGHLRCIAGEGYGDHHQMLDQARTEVLKIFAQAHKVTVNTLVQAAWLLLLQRYTGQSAVCFGATVAGRPMELAGIEQQVGLFINTLPVAGAPREDETVEQWLQRVQALNLSLREYEHAPLFEVQRWAGFSGEALFDSLLVFENYPVSEALQQGAPSDLRFGPVEDHEETNYPLTLGVGLGETLGVHYSFDRRFLDDHAVVRLAGHFQQLLLALAEDGQRCLGELPLLTADERERLDAWNPAAEAVVETSIHRLIEAQVTRTPETIALVAGERSLSYAE